MRWASATSATVSEGSCRNEADTGVIALAAEGTVSPALAHSPANGLAVLNGMDEKGLDNLTVSPITCSQIAGVITASASVLPHYIEHALTGTISVAGVTVTGVGTKFLSEVSVGDLIGDPTWTGWSQVTAIASDTSLTTGLFAVAGPGGAPGTVIHNATVQPAGAAIDKVTAIDAAGISIVVPTAAAHPGGSSLTIGAHAASTWLAVWVIDDGITPGLLISTQHETLLAPPPGYASFRRVGWIYNETTAPALREIFYPDGGVERHAVYEMAAQPVQVVTANSAVWASVDYSAVAPRTCLRLELRAVGSNTTGIAQNRTFFRARGAGDAAVNRGRRLGMAIGEVQDDVILLVDCDGAQVSDYGMDNAAMTISIALIGFIDTL
jgi:hypothetical protein